MTNAEGNLIQGVIVTYSDDEKTLFGTGLPGEFENIYLRKQSITDAKRHTLSSWILFRPRRIEGGVNFALYNESTGVYKYFRYVVC